jgi:hypothetical protein
LQHFCAERDLIEEKMKSGAQLIDDRKDLIKELLEKVHHDLA